MIIDDKDAQFGKWVLTKVVALAWEDIRTLTEEVITYNMAYKKRTLNDFLSAYQYIKSKIFQDHCGILGVSSRAFFDKNGELMEEKMKIYEQICQTTFDEFSL